MHLMMDNGAHGPFTADVFEHFMYSKKHFVQLFETSDHGFGMIDHANCVDYACEFNDTNIVEFMAGHGLCGPFKENTFKFVFVNRNLRLLKCLLECPNNGFDQFDHSLYVSLACDEDLPDFLELMAKHGVHGPFSEMNFRTAAMKLGHKTLEVLLLIPNNGFKPVDHMDIVIDVMSSNPKISKLIDDIGIELKKAHL
jgi:hypothetical protein